MKKRLKTDTHFSFSNFNKHVHKNIHLRKKTEHNSDKITTLVYKLYTYIITSSPGTI